MADELSSHSTRGPAPPSTAQLVLRIADGDLEAERLLFQRYHKTTRLLAQRHCRGRYSDAEDVLQDVFSELFRHLRAGELRDPAALPFYLRQSIEHRCVSLFRQLPATPLQTDATELQAQQPSPLHQLLREEARVTLLKLMYDLPQERDRELLHRFYVQQQERAEICADLQIDALHFRKVLSRARSRMRELIQKAGLQHADHDG